MSSNFIELTQYDNDEKVVVKVDAIKLLRSNNRYVDNDCTGTIIYLDRKFSVEVNESIYDIVKLIDNIEKENNNGTENISSKV